MENTQMNKSIDQWKLSDSFAKYPNSEIIN